MIEKKPVSMIEIGIFELLLAIVHRKRFVLLFTLISAILVTVYCFVAPQKWSSRALISPIADNTTNLQLSADMLSSFGNMPMVGSAKMDMAVEFLTIMDSRTFREGIIRKFNLIKYFELAKPDSSANMELALQKLSDTMVKSVLEPQSNTIELTVLTKDKLLSKNIAEYYIQALEHYVKYQKKVKSKITREFLEGRTADIQARIDALLEQNRQFESKGKAFAMDAQTKQSLDLYSELASQQILNDIELEVARQQYGSASPKVTELETKQTLLAQKIDDFEQSNATTLPKYVLRLQDIPQANMQYNKIQLDLKIMNSVYEYLYPMTEAAKLTELKEMPAIEVMDRPSLAGLRAKPQRLMLILVVSLAALLLASLLAILDAFISTEQKSYLRALGKELGISKSGN